jgi:hypothetical protein
VIKRITLVNRRPSVAADEFASQWRDAVAASLAALPDRPTRVAACTVLRGVAADEAPHDGLMVEWFIDAAALARHDAWLRTPEGVATAIGVDALIEPGSVVEIVAEEVVMRGGEWLEQRRRQGGTRWVHMALARRAPGLTPAEFSARWRDHAGQVSARGAATPVAVPDEASGRAYAQSHPVPRPSGEWRYDAVTEVWFDDLAGMSARIEWFRQNLVADDLFAESSFLAVTEELLLPD